MTDVPWTWVEMWTLYFCSNITLYSENCDASFSEIRYQCGMMLPRRNLSCWSSTERHCCVPCRCLPETVSELQAKAQHRILHLADIHALHPHHHPILGVILDKLWCFSCQGCIRYDVTRAGDWPERCSLTISYSLCQTQDI